MEVKVYNIGKSDSSLMTLPEIMYSASVRPDLVARVVRWQLAKRRSGNHQVKRIADVSGTTKKPFRQKGTGNARQGSLRSPQMRGGATMHGPVSRSHEYKLQKKVRKAALRSVVVDKINRGKVVIVGNFNDHAGKTRELVEFLGKLSASSVLFIGNNACDNVTVKAVNNIPNCDVLPVKGLNVYDIVHRDYLFICRDEISSIEDRLL